MFRTESEFENHIRNLIKTRILVNEKDLVLLDNKDVVDIIICNNKNEGHIFFIEAKFHTQIKNRIGFGAPNGKGFQPEILTLRPKYFDNHMLWVFGQENDNNFYILDNNEVSKYFAGGKIGEKQNNFQPKLFCDEYKYGESQFIEQLKSWLTKYPPR